MSDNLWNDYCQNSFIYAITRSGGIIFVQEGDVMRNMKKTVVVMGLALMITSVHLMPAEKKVRITRREKKRNNPPGAVPGGVPVPSLESMPEGNIRMPRRVAGNPPGG